MICALESQRVRVRTDHAGDHPLEVLSAKREPREQSMHTLHVRYEATGQEMVRGCRVFRELKETA